MAEFLVRKIGGLWVKFTLRNDMDFEKKGNGMNGSFRSIGRSAIGALVIICATALQAKEYVITGSYGNQLHLIDGESLKVVRSYRVPGAATGPTYMVPSRDGKVIYVVTNRWKSISGIDLDSGEEVFRANLSGGDVQQTAFFGIDISPDNNELYVAVQRYRKLSDQFQVLDPKILVFSTASGKAATPIRQLSAPRQIQQIVVSVDGNTVYAQAPDIYAIDARSGEVKEKFSFREWSNSVYEKADSLALMGQHMNSSWTYAAQFYASSKDGQGRGFGMLSIDLKTGKVATDIIGKEEDGPGVYTMSVNPANTNEVYAIGLDSVLKIDRAQKRVVARSPVDQIFWVSQVSADGTRYYAGGGICNVGVFSTKDLSRIGTVKTPNCAEQAMASIRVINR